MRFVLTVVLAALLIVVAYLGVSWFVDGYWGGNIYPNDAEPDTWSAPDSWSEWRDIVIVFGGFFFALAGIFLCVLLGVAIYLLVTIRRLLRDNLAPALDSARDLADEVRGTTEFVSETAVAPIIRVYSIVSGVRRGVSTVGGLGKRFRRD